MAAVLAKVQKEVGPNATISSAQKIRSGGLFGFFQRERYEVFVTEEEKAQPDPTQGTQTGLGATASPAPTQGTQTGLGATASPGTTQGTQTGLGTPLETVEVAKEEGRVAKSVLDLAELTNKEEVSEIVVEPAPKAAKAKTASTASTPPKEPSPVPKSETPKIEPQPQISTESNSFAEVLSRVAFQAHMTSQDDSNAAVGPQTPSEPVQTAPVAPQPAPPIVVDEEPQNVAPVEPKVETKVEAKVEPKVEPMPDRPAFLETTATPKASPAPATPAAREPIVMPAAQETQVPAMRTRATDHPLAALGLPTEYIPVGVHPEDLQDALTTALDRLLPKTPDIRPSKGSVICVVGDRGEAMEVAEELARQWGRPAEEIVLASKNFRGKGSANVLRTVRNAEDAHRSWSRRPRPTIVAIESAPGSRDSSWAEHLLTALEPIATYGVTDATRKSDDIVAWAHSLGGVDCLAINGVEDTVSPAAVLGTGIPVERVDGRKVSPAYWALLLTERLAAA